jgi:hypothetical protein
MGIQLKPKIPPALDTPSEDSRQPDLIDAAEEIEADNEMKRLEKIALAAGGPDLQGEYHDKK